MYDRGSLSLDFSHQLTKKKVIWVFTVESLKDAKFKMYILLWKWNLEILYKNILILQLSKSSVSMLEVIKTTGITKTKQKFDNLEEYVLFN